MSYIAKYILIIILGDLVKILGIYSIYSLPWIVLIPFNYLAIKYGIIYPARKKNEKDYKTISIPLTVATTALDILFLSILGVERSSIIVLSISNILGMIYLLRNEDKNLPENIAKHNIDEYFSNIKTSSHK